MKLAKVGEPPPSQHFISDYCKMWLNAEIKYKKDLYCRGEVVFGKFVRTVSFSSVD